MMPSAIFCLVFLDCNNGVLKFYVYTCMACHADSWVCFGYKCNYIKLHTGTRAHLCGTSDNQISKM